MIMIDTENVLTKAMEAYVDQLSNVEADRVLQGMMQPIGPLARGRHGLPELRAEGCRCLMMTAQAVDTWSEVKPVEFVAREAGYNYEFQCAHHSHTVVNAAIRNRILSNQARRTLQQEPAYAMVLR